MRIACVTGLRYPEVVDDRGLDILTTMLRDRGVGLILLLGDVIARPELGLLEYVVSEIVERVEAGVAVVPGSCEASVPGGELRSSWDVLREVSLVVRRAGGHPLHEEPMVTDGVGVLGVPVLLGGGCNGGVESWGLPRDLLEEIWAGRLLRHYKLLLEEYAPRRLVVAVYESRRSLESLVRLAAVSLAALDSRVAAIVSNVGGEGVMECGEALHPLILDA
ncbi:hypothetical protein Pyrfu_1916 [Pyrolobus fumarii 1A]|uniref:Uncharacterized protein n=1 Tax=Pyrolobus fumarii (strain DSM 11204 / 1A) TaxID=694429 RepID=G0ED91_PYRF1|nr:hypothetical protein [Pyrolobus fumarii]AEM39769.1 hypothetical protein Pyrfu_1916 [Pyrolobus fumarii 1A]